MEKLVDQAERLRAVEDLDRSLCVEAGAGTGKTTLLINRYLSIIKSGRARCSRVVAITFTEKAAGEMKVRLRIEIKKFMDSGAIDPAEWERLAIAQHELERAPISTIHSFASSILREYPLEAGIDPGFEQLDALESALFLDECWNEFLSRMSQPYVPVLKRFLSLGGSALQLRTLAFQLYDGRGERYVEGILKKYGSENSAGRETVRGGYVGGRGERATPGVMVDTGALSVLKNTVRDVTRTLVSLVEKHCVNFNDLGCLEIRRFNGDVEIMERLEGEELEDFLLTVTLPKPKGNKSNWDPPKTCTEQKELITELVTARSAHRRQFNDRMRDALGGWLEGFIDFVERRKADEGVLDFDDLLIQARKLMQSEKVLHSLRQRYRYILVDEFQDIDPLQAEIILLLAGESTRSAADEEEGGRLFVVGDPKQSIYRFRGADVEIYEAVKERFSETGSHLTITQNFRSVPGIVEWVNEAFSHIIRRPEGGMYQPGYEPIYARRTGAGCSVVLLDCELEDGTQKADEVRRCEGRVIARLIHRLIDEGREVMDTTTKEMRRLRYGDIAVIYPGTTGIDYYEDPLRSEAIPYITEGGKLYYTRQEIRDLAAALWAVEDPWDSLSLVASLRSALFGFSDEELFLFIRNGGRFHYLAPNCPDGERFADFRAACELMSDLHRGRNERGPAGTLIDLLERTKFMELSLLRPHGDQLALNIRKAVQTARTFQGRLHSYRHFARWFRDQDMLGAAEGESPLVEGDEDAVRLITIHKSKGLQFPVVVLANLVQKRHRPPKILLRGGRRLTFHLGSWMEASDFSSLAEVERLKGEAETARLMYVAATRAGDLLVVPRVPNKGNYFDLLTDHLPIEEDIHGSGALSSSEGNARKFVETWRASDLPALRGTPKPFIKLPTLDERELEEVQAVKNEWLVSRAGLIERGKRGPLIITPSRMVEVFTSLDIAGAGVPEPEALEERRGHYAGSGVLETEAGRIAVPDHDSISRFEMIKMFAEDDQAVRFGSAFHRVMELVDLRTGEGLTEIAEVIAREHDIENEVQQLVDLSRRALSHELVMRAAKASRCYREVPFAVPLNGHFLQGRIDLIFEFDGQWTVVDYKTDDVSGNGVDGRFRTYRVQGEFYAAALKRLDIDVKGGIVFYFVRPNESRSLEVSEDLFVRVENLIRSATLWPKSQ